METQKLLIKEVVIIFATILFAFLVGYYYDNYTYAGLYLYSLLALIIFTPPLALIFMRIRKNQKLNKLTLVLKIFLWFSICFFALAVSIGVISEITFFNSPLYNPFFSLSQSIAYAMTDFFSLNYWLSGNWLEWPEWLLTIIKQLPSAAVYYSPYLVMVALLVWAGFVNKKMELKNN